MFPQPIRKSENHNGPTLEGRFVISDRSYGKNAVKIMYVERNGPVHVVKEMEVNTHLKLYSQKDYIYGDNSDIVATDSQKNTVYILAKKYGIKGPEDFGLLLAKHFLGQYNHVEEVHIHIEEYPWQRICKDEFNSTYNSMDDGCGVNYSTFNDRLKHNHAFLFTPTAKRHCDVILSRKDKTPVIMAGLSGLRVLKTTQSSFVNFVNDEFRSLEDQHDRIFSTVVECNWQYSHVEPGTQFCRIYDIVKDAIVKNFAGDMKMGVPSPSVQNTLYLTEKEILESVPQISAINMTMPNKHYHLFDSKPFQNVIPGENSNVFVPTDKPFGIIYAQLDRKDLRGSKL